MKRYEKVYQLFCNNEIFSVPQKLKNQSQKNSLYSRKWNFVALILKKYIYSQRKAFLKFPEMEACTFQPMIKKQKIKINLPQENFLGFKKPTPPPPTLPHFPHPPPYTHTHIHKHTKAKILISGDSIVLFFGK